MPNPAESAQPTDAPTDPHPITLRITIPWALTDHFEAQAIVANMPLEEFLAQHITKTAMWGADEAPIYIDDTGRLEIQRLLGAKVSTPDRLLEMIRRIVGWKAGPHKIELSPNQMEQIECYARTLGKKVEDFAPQLLMDAITERLQTR